MKRNSIRIKFTLVETVILFEIEMIEQGVNSFSTTVSVVLYPPSYYAPLQMEYLPTIVRMDAKAQMLNLDGAKMRQLKAGLIYPLLKLLRYVNTALKSFEDCRFFSFFSTNFCSQKRTRGLSFDLVATRNIGTDEEIFIDYGTAWLHAWDEHVTKWENRTVGNIATVSDQFTVCHYWEEDDSEDANLNDIPSGIDWTQLEDSVFLELFSTDGSRFEMHKSGSYWPCSILDDDGNDLTVRIFQSRWHDTTQWEENNIPRILTNYPTRSVNSFFKPYKSPLHSPGAFRHFVDLPLGLIPKHWHDEKVETPLTRYKLGERVELRDRNSDSWLRGTIIDDESISVLLDDVDIIETDVSPNDLRWPTQILHLAASGHPFH